PCGAGRSAAPPSATRYGSARRSPSWRSSNVDCPCDSILRLARERPMVATDKLFAGSIPEIYDRYLVPLIFEPYALDLAERVAARQPRRVLETPAGPGGLTGAMAARLPATHIVATDLNQPMLDHATRRQASGGIEWRPADALALPFEDQGFDVVA